MRNPNKNSKTNPLNHTVLPQKANNHTQSYKQQTNSNKWLMFRRNPKFWIQITSRNKMQLVLRTWEIITIDAASFQILQSQEPSRIEIKKNIEQLLNRYELNSTSFQNETFRIVKLNNNWSLRSCKEKKKKKKVMAVVVGKSNCKIMKWTCVTVSFFFCFFSLISLPKENSFLVLFLVAFLKKQKVSLCWCFLFKCSLWSIERKKDAAVGPLL